MRVLGGWMGGRVVNNDMDTLTLLAVEMTETAIAFDVHVFISSYERSLC